MITNAEKTGTNCASAIVLVNELKDLGIDLSVQLNRLSHLADYAKAVEALGA